MIVILRFIRSLLMGLSPKDWPSIQYRLNQEVSYFTCITLICDPLSTKHVGKIPYIYCARYQKIIWSNERTLIFCQLQNEVDQLWPMFRIQLFISRKRLANESEGFRFNFPIGAWTGLASFWDPISLRGSGDLWVKNSKKLAVINIGWVRLSPCKWPKVGRGAAK